MALRFKIKTNKPALNIGTDGVNERTFRYFVVSLANQRKPQSKKNKL